MKVSHISSVRNRVGALHGSAQVPRCTQWNSVSGADRVRFTFVGIFCATVACGGAKMTCLKIDTAL